MNISDYVSARVFDGTRPITGRRLETLKAKRARRLNRQTFTNQEPHMGKKTKPKPRPGGGCK